MLWWYFFFAFFSFLRGDRPQSRQKQTELLFCFLRVFSSFLKRNSSHCRCFSTRIVRRPVRPRTATQLSCSNTITSTFFANVWQVASTLTTLGYGDINPRTIGGRAIASLVAWAGVIVVAVASTALMFWVPMMPFEEEVCNARQLFVFVLKQESFVCFALWSELWEFND
jgi:hypothetical protein